ncbi:serine hydrolase domain-containing protein [Parahaliea mediterranea]|uniref:Serine hydrolase n=1 Tax=Parahaliea mediterranea TaxID=651086 RepID=A0A939DF56_9GAMM|nr:serine hydrolase [Parahaliea mediterranea]MBN7796990.1 serine hydrolase [Parahaliea mediterranea]
MKRATLIVSLVLIGLVALAWVLLRPALEVAVGYTAKQTCSGLLVSGLPADFIWERDVAPRMAILGPLRDRLRGGITPQRTGVSSTFLGVTARASYAPGRGCSLHKSRGEAATPRAAARRPSAPVVAPRALEAALDQAFAEPAGGGRNTLAVLVSRRGSLIAERYLPPVSPDMPLQGWSMNKSLMATWVGMQVARGQLTLDQPVRAALARAPGGDALAPAVDPGLNLGHLLHMESGLDFEETYLPGGDATRMLYRSEAMWAAAPATGQAVGPGERFSYSSGDTNLAALVWQQSLGDTPYTTWLRREFAGPLGLHSLVAEADASGVQVGSSYAFMTARDWLGVGQLWLDAWHGRSPVLGRDWQRAAVRPRSAAADGAYGRGFWLNTAGVAFPALPDTLFFASGNSGQAVVVLPEQETVVVRLGLTADGVDSGLAELLAAVANALATDNEGVLQHD